MNSNCKEIKSNIKLINFNMKCNMEKQSKTSKKHNKEIILNRESSVNSLQVLSQQIQWRQIYPQFSGPESPQYCLHFLGQFPQATRYNGLLELLNSGDGWFTGIPMKMGKVSITSCKLCPV